MQIVRKDSRSSLLPPDVERMINAGFPETKGRACRRGVAKIGSPNLVVCFDGLTSKYGLCLLGRTDKIIGDLYSFLAGFPLDINLTSDSESGRAGELGYAFKIRRIS